MGLQICAAHLQSVVALKCTGGPINNTLDGATVTKTSEDHIQFLDQLRGLAIFSVFAFHCMVTAYYPVLGTDQLKWNGWWRDFHAPASFLALLPLTLGWAGVAIFFVISGFCIHLSHERSRQKGWKTFFLRRFFRIYPPYLVSLLFFGLVFPLTRLNFTAHVLHVHAEWFYSLVQLGVHLLLVHNFSAISLKGINPPFWSIAVEVQLYLLYPLVHRLLKSKGLLPMLWLSGGIELGLRSVEAVLIMLHPNRDIPVWFANEPFIFWFSWTIGAVLAEAWLSGKPLPFRHSLWVWPLVTLLCYGIRPLSIFCFPLTALSTVALISALLSTDVPLFPARLDFLAGHLRFAGIVSYSAYLIHMPLLYFVPVLASSLFPGYPFNPPAVAALCLVAWFPILALSYLMYRWIELPSIASGKSIIQRQQGVAP